MKNNFSLEDNCKSHVCLSLSNPPVDWKSGTEEELKDYMRSASKDPELWGEIRRQIEDLSRSVNEKIDD